MIHRADWLDPTPQEEAADSNALFDLEEMLMCRALGVGGYVKRHVNAGAFVYMGGARFARRAHRRLSLLTFVSIGGVLQGIRGVTMLRNDGLRVRLPFG